MYLRTFCCCAPFWGKESTTSISPKASTATVCWTPPLAAAASPRATWLCPTSSTTRSRGRSSARWNRELWHLGKKIAILSSQGWVSAYSPALCTAAAVWSGAELLPVSLSRTKRLFSLGSAALFLSGGDPKVYTPPCSWPIWVSK